MSTRQTLRAGVLGCGEIGRRGHIPGFQAAGIEVVAVCDTNLPRAQTVAKEMHVSRAYADYKELLADPDIDVVSVGLPNVLHAPVTIAALEAGKHVLCEKPFATSPALAEQMIAASRRAGKMLSINQHLRFEGSSRAMREAVAEGRLGHVYLADVRMIRSSGIPGYGSWFTNKDMAGAGALYDIGVHMLDLAMFLLGFPKVTAVRGMLSSALGEQKIGLGGWGIDRGTSGRFDVDDTAIAHIALADGGLIRLIVTWAAFGASEERVTLFGTQGGADRSPDRYGRDTPLRFYQAGKGGMDAVIPDLSRYPSGGASASIASFISAIRGESPLMVKPEEALQTTRILELIQQSALSGREIAA
ncbi:MAG: Gfo/Idh/MocA family oxidoreductase [Chloroflexi bacterium]|nr:Gfo/Idh/MocA family oxidoreductase [Chloroflexota bacterium]MCL5275230.1 Gfo/Idh/MocA family oxidoreductase [Chloroflexota bacterium]